MGRMRRWTCSRVAAPGPGRVAASRLSFALKSGFDRCSRERDERLSEKGADRVRREAVPQSRVLPRHYAKGLAREGSDESNGSSPAPQAEGDLAVAGGDDEQAARARRHPHDDPPALHPLQELHDGPHEPGALGLLQGPA